LFSKDEGGGEKGIYISSIGGKPPSLLRGERPVPVIFAPSEEDRLDVYFFLQPKLDEGDGSRGG